MKLTKEQIQAEIDRLTPIVEKQQAEAGMNCDPWGSAEGQELLRLQRIQSARKINAMHPGNRFRLMFGQPQLPEDQAKFDSVLGAVTRSLQKHMAEKRNDITEELLANAVTQALLCGDFQIHIAYGPNMTEGQSVAYMPARQVATLKGQLEEAARKPTPSEVMDWVERNGLTGSCVSAKTAIEDARSIHNAAP